MKLKESTALNLVLITRNHLRTQNSGENYKKKKTKHIKSSLFYKLSTAKKASKNANFDQLREPESGLI